jgi:hypothetical protein
MKGLLFRKVDDEKKLEIYHSQIPFEYIVQELVTYPLEVSVFYYRYPNSKKGVVTGFIQKDLMEVVGDGKSTVWELILQHPQARYRLDEMKIRHEENAGYIPANGEQYLLAHAANLNRGARFINLAHEIDADLVNVFDAISIPAQFYYGRFDIKCRSIEDLKKESIFPFLNIMGAERSPIMCTSQVLVCSRPIRSFYVTGRFCMRSPHSTIKKESGTGLLKKDWLF